MDGIDEFYNEIRNDGLDTPHTLIVNFIIDENGLIIFTQQQITMYCDLLEQIIKHYIKNANASNKNTQNTNFLYCYYLTEKYCIQSHKIKLDEFHLYADVEKNGFLDELKKILSI